MKIFDLHNDVLTKTKDFSCNFSHNCEVICAIYKGNLSMEKSFLIAKKGGNHLKEQPKIIFANKIDTKVFDKEFYLKLLKHIAELKQNQTKNN